MKQDDPIRQNAAPAPPTFHRIECPRCGTPCFSQEKICWKCGALLIFAPPDAATEETPPVPTKRTQVVLRLTFCKACGCENDERSVACRLCAKPLEAMEVEIVEEAPEPPLPAWRSGLRDACYSLLAFAGVL